MVAAAIRTIFAQPTGAEVVDQVDKVAAMLTGTFPAVAAMLTDAHQDLTAFASFPTAHRAKIWSTNPLERVNKEVKPRTNVVGIFPTTPRCCGWPGRCWSRPMMTDPRRRGGQPPSSPPPSDQLEHTSLSITTTPAFPPPHGTWADLAQKGAIRP